MTETTPVFDGLITFYASHHAMRAEKLLKAAGYRVMLVPGPREISPNCGVAMQFEFVHAQSVRDLLVKGRVQIEEIHNYRIEASDDSLHKFRS